MSRLPTELQCLAQRMRDTAQELALAAARLPDVVAVDAACSRQETPPDPLVPVPVARAADAMLMQARTLEFDAQRLEYLADEIADYDRTAYSYAMVLVDACRMARGQTMGATATADDHALVLKLADTVEDGLADIQELLAERFPGEHIPGD